MKQPWDWTEEDMLSLIASGEKESITLDYKSCDALAQSDGKKNELSKDASAFANSAGGTLLYGMIEDGHVPVRIDGGFDRTVITKEWIEQVINSRIQRRIDGVRINQIELPKSAPGRVAYAVHVPQSARAPHQAGDKRFYKRFNFESVPMEEYEIRDVARRLESPDLEISFSAELQPATPGDATRLAHLIPIISNNSAEPAEYVVVHLYVDKRVAIRDLSDMKNIGDHTLELPGNRTPCAHLHMNHGIPGKIPIFEGAPFRLTRGPIVLTLPAPGQYVLGSRLFSPRMTPKANAGLLVWDGTYAVVVNK